MGGDDHDAVEKAFHEAVNMTPADLERWLQTDESRSVGMKRDGEKESVGHESGRRIVAIKRTKKADLTDDDHAEITGSSGTCTAIWPRSRAATSRTRAGVTP